MTKWFALVLALTACGKSRLPLNTERQCDQLLGVAKQPHDTIVVLMQLPDCNAWIWYKQHNVPMD